MSPLHRGYSCSYVSLQNCQDTKGKRGGENQRENQREIQRKNKNKKQGEARNGWVLYLKNVGQRVSLKSK